ncbi:UNVERIFIED_CONTAM: hypothetical protein FKN15_073885 [Acipenser sinensis]
MKRRKADIQDFFIKKKPQAQNRDSAGQAESTESNSEGQGQQPECSQGPSHVEQNFRGQTSAHRPDAPREETTDPDDDYAELDDSSSSRNQAQIFRGCTGGHPPPL